MRKFETRLLEVRVELVTTTFVASGRPEGVHDLGRLLENLNNPTLSRQIQLTQPAVRPLYRAGSQLFLDAPLLVRRDEIIFANFEGPHFTRGLVRPAETEVSALFLAPPFQIAGTVSLPAGADITQALRTLIHGFFPVRHARVFDADGSALGEGEQIIVNATAVQMASATRQHFAVPAPAAPRAVAQPVEEPAEAPEKEERAARAA